MISCNECDDFMITRECTRSVAWIRALSSSLSWMWSYRLLSVYTGFFFFSSRRRHTRLQGDWSSDVCSSDLQLELARLLAGGAGERAALVAEELALEQLGGQRRAVDLHERLAAPRRALVQGEIGRAACRERV